MAGDFTPGDDSQQRALHAAPLDCDRTTRMKPTTRGRRERTRNLATQRQADPGSLAHRVRHRNGLNQAARVRMQRLIANPIAIADLYDLTQIHHRNLVRDLAYR